MNKNNSSLLVIGSVALDSIKTPFGETSRALGGSASYFSLAASYFTTPALVAVVGEDFLPSDLDTLKNKGVDLSGLAVMPGKTFAWGGEYGFDMNSRTTLFTELNVFENFSPTLPEAHSNAEFLFLGNIHPALQIQVLKQVKHPKLIGLDTMNFWIESAAGELAQAMQMADVIIINDSEARELTKQHNPLKAAREILSMMSSGKKNIPATLIIKRGEYGLLMFQEKKIFHLPGYPLEDVADPTGAGDTFAGGFFGYLAKTKDLSWENLKLACAAGSTLASFCCEDLGTAKLVRINKADIDQRIFELKHLVNF